jgi:hypothetical protein
MKVKSKRNGDNISWKWKGKFKLFFLAEKKVRGYENGKKSKNFRRVFKG